MALEQVARCPSWRSPPDDGRCAAARAAPPPLFSRPLGPRASRHLYIFHKFKRCVPGEPPLARPRGPRGASTCLARARAAANGQARRGPRRPPPPSPPRSAPPPLLPRSARPGNPPAQSLLREQLSPPRSTPRTPPLPPPPLPPSPCPARPGTSPSQFPLPPAPPPSGWTHSHPLAPHPPSRGARTATQQERAAPPASHRPPRHRAARNAPARSRPPTRPAAACCCKTTPSPTRRHLAEHPPRRALRAEHRPVRVADHHVVHGRRHGGRQGDRGAH